MVLKRGELEGLDGCIGLIDGKYQHWHTTERHVPRLAVV